MPLATSPVISAILYFFFSFASFSGDIFDTQIFRFERYHPPSLAKFLLISAFNWSRIASIFAIDSAAARYLR